MAFGFSLLVSTPRFRLLRAVGYTLVAALLLILLAPFIVAKTPISTWLIAQATKDLPITVSVGSLSLGWFTSLSAENVVIQDKKGNALAQIPRVTADRNLMNLAISQKELGKIRVERANIDLVFANNSSNLEDVLSQLPKAEPKQATLPRRGAPPAATYAIECVDGTVRVVDADKSKTWQLTKVELRLSHDPTSGSALTGLVTAAVTGEGEPGVIDLKIDGDMVAAIRGKLTAKLQSIPAGIAGPILRRSQPGLACTGRLNGDFLSSWFLAQDGTPVFQMVTKIEGNDLEFSGGAFGDERIPVKNFKLPLKMEHYGTYLTFDCPDVTCDLGRATAKGKLTFNRPLLNSLSDPDTTVMVDLDLVRLAEVMPKTLNLHKDVRIQVGRIKIDGKSVSSPNGPLLDVKLVVGNLSGTRGNTAINWPEPLNLTFKVRPTAKAIPDIEEIYCKAIFMSLEGKASAGRIKVDGNIDLGQLAPKVGQFVDISALGLAGRADLVVKMSWPDKNTLNILADVNLSQFQWGLWREPQLVLNADVQLISEKSQQQIQQSSTLRVAAHDDLLDVKLRENFVFGDKGRDGAFYVTLDGDLARWQQRLKPFVGTLGGVAFQGQAKGQAMLAMKASKLDVQSVKLSTKNLKVDGAGLDVHEPELDFQATMTHDAQGSWLKFSPITATLNQGKLRLSPSVCFDPARELIMPAGRVVENAKITPAMFASALGYTLPLLANVATADGEVSLQLDSARVPLGEPEKSEMQGTLVLHHAKVGPGPLITDLLGILKTTSPVSIIRDNQVKVKLDKGRVYHDNLELLFTDNMTIRTSGSVGLDGSLDMIAEMPIPTRLLGNLKLPATIARTSIRLPITGTINQPRIDRSALTNALNQAGLDAAGGAVGDLLRKGLDSQLNKLLKPKN